MNTFEKHFKAYMEIEYGRKILKCDHGFAIYEIRGKELLVAEIFIEEEQQGKGHALKLALAMEEIAKASGCGFMSAIVSVGPNRIHTSTELLRKYINFGFKICRVVSEGEKGGHIIMIRFLEGENKNGNSDSNT